MEKSSAELQLDDELLKVIQKVKCRTVSGETKENGKF